MRVAFRLLNTLAFVIPPAGIIMYFVYRDENPGQAFWFLIWAVLGGLMYIGILN
jgi:RsiW-degrading membrane proteinase PrsW (M82 family)